MDPSISDQNDQWVLKQVPTFDFFRTKKKLEMVEVEISVLFSKIKKNCFKMSRDLTGSFKVD